MMMTEITIGVEEKLVDEIEMYPNPATDRITIKAGSRIEQLEMYNQVGQLVKVLKADNSILNMGVSDLQPGIYFVKISSSNQVRVDPTRVPDPRRVH